MRYNTQLILDYIEVDDVLRETLKSTIRAEVRLFHELPESQRDYPHLYETLARSVRDDVEFYVKHMTRDGLGFLKNIDMDDVTWQIVEWKLRIRLDE